MKLYYEDPHLTLYHGDCMDLLATLPAKAFDLAIVDPPYGIGRSGKPKSTSSHGGHKGFEDKQWDNSAPNFRYFEYLEKSSSDQIIFGANYYPQFCPKGPGWILWDKGQRIDQADGELAASSLNKPFRVFTLNRVALQVEGTIHPTQKPVALYRWLLANYAKPGQTILDTHLGSGSIAIACHYAGHHLTAIEKDEDYIKAALERYKRETAQQDMFAPKPSYEPQLEQAAFL